MPDIIYVDNEPDQFIAQASPQQKERITEYIYDEGDPPGAFEAANSAALWLFDFFIVDRQADASLPENGLSLFQRWQAAVKGGRPVTVLVSHQLEQAIRQPVGVEARHHVIAQRLGVEWVGNKSARTMERVLQLADASRLVTDVLEKFSVLDIETLCFDVLGVPTDAPWVSSAKRQIDRARPPRPSTALIGTGAARPIVAWLVAHVLPYPSFLLTDAQAAVRLGMNPMSFREMVETEGRVDLTSFRYKGPLADFLGRRWWRAAVDRFAYDISQASENPREAISGVFPRIAFEWLDQDEPVVVSDPDLVETDRIADASECVRATDEDFPANVEPAWILISDVKENKELAAKVIFEDRGLLEASDDN